MKPVIVTPGSVKSTAFFTLTVFVPCSEQYSAQPVVKRSTGFVIVAKSITDMVYRSYRVTLFPPYSDTYRLPLFIATAFGLLSPVSKTVFVAPPSGSVILISLPVPGMSVRNGAGPVLSWLTMYRF